MKTSAPRTSYLQLMFMWLTTLSVGMLIGFNMNSLTMKTCCTYPAVKPTEAGTVRSSAPAMLIKRQEPSTKKQEVKEVNSEDAKPVFISPEKFLIDVPMPPPATFFNLRPWKVIQEFSQTPEQYFLMILVKSASQHTKRRFQIRLTWGSLSSIEGKKIAVMFLVGVSSTKSQQKLFEEENALYGDIIQADVLDTYRQLPAKVLSGYQFVAEHLGNASEFFMLADDDCVIHIPNTLLYFDSLAPEDKDSLHCGHIYYPIAYRITDKKSKWRVTDDIYPKKTYPGYCNGPMTVLPFNMLQEIYNVSLRTNYTGFSIDDVLVNGILREKLSKRDSNIRQMSITDPNTKEKLSIMWHLGYDKDKDEKFIKLWSEIKQRLSDYQGSFDPKAGFRSTITPLNTIEGETVMDTILHFFPEANKSEKEGAYIKNLLNAVGNEKEVEDPNMQKH